MGQPAAGFEQLPASDPEARLASTLTSRELAGVVALVRQEQAVAQRLVEGRASAEIAEILARSEATVKFHAGHVLTKLGTTSRQGGVATLIAERCLT